MRLMYEEDVREGQREYRTAGVHLFVIVSVATAKLCSHIISVQLVYLSRPGDRNE